MYVYTHTHTNIYAHTRILQVNECTSRAYHRDMGWLQLVGSLKLQVSFGEYSLFYEAFF